MAGLHHSHFMIGNGRDCLAATDQCRRNQHRDSDDKGEERAESHLARMRSTVGSFNRLPATLFQTAHAMQPCACQDGHHARSLRCAVNRSFSKSP